MNFFLPSTNLHQLVLCPSRSSCSFCHRSTVQALAAASKNASAANDFETEKNQGPHQPWQKISRCLATRCPNSRSEVVAQNILEFGCQSWCKPFCTAIDSDKSGLKTSVPCFQPNCVFFGFGHRNCCGARCHLEPCGGRVFSNPWAMGTATVGFPSSMVNCFERCVVNVIFRCMTKHAKKT